MAITPADIEQQTFSPSKHGYDTEEVDSFLEQLAGEIDAMLQKIADLKGRLTSSEQQLASAQAQIANLEEQGTVLAAPVPAPVVAASAPVDSLGASERQISQVLIVAQQSADKLVADARDNAERIRNDADAKAREVIRQALAEKQNELDEIDRLKQSREDFRGAYHKLLQKFMDDAEAVFPTQMSLSSSPTGSAGTTRDVTPAPVAVSAQVSTPSAMPPAGLGDFGDLD